MAELLSLVELVRDDKNVIIGVKCKNRYGQIATIEASKMREYILNKTYIVDGLEVNGRGLQDVRGKKKNIPEQHNDYQLIISELRDIKRTLRDKTVEQELDTIKKQLRVLGNKGIEEEISKIKEKLSDTGVSQDYNSLIEELSDISSKLDILTSEQRKNAIEQKYGQDTILNQLKDLGVTNDEQFQALFDRVGYLFSDKTIDGTIKYPRCKEDLNYNLVYYDKDVTLSKEAFEKEIGAEQYCYEYDELDRIVKGSKRKVIFNLEYNKEFIDSLRKEIELVNTARVKTENVFEKDIEFEHYVDDKDLIEGLDGISLIGKGIATKLSTVTKIAKGVVKAGKGISLSFLKTFFETDSDLINNRRKNGLGTFEDRNTGVFNEYDFTTVDKNDMLSDEQNSILYVNDIRLFIINSKCCMVEKGNMEKKNSAGNSYKKLFSNEMYRPYYKYIEGSIVRLPIKDDIKLFNFYCLFYLSKITTVDKDHKYSKSTTGSESYKTYMDLVTNAYFAAKKSMLAYGITFLDMLDDINNIQNEETLQLYYLFLLRLKYCLVIQGVKAEKAEWFIQRFMEYDNTLNLFK